MMWKESISLGDSFCPLLTTEHVIAQEGDGSCHFSLLTGIKEEGPSRLLQREEEGIAT